MQGYIAVLTIIFLVVLVAVRVIVLRKHGIEAIHFGNLDKKDFLIPPFPLFYFYLIFAEVFNWPTVSSHRFFQSNVISWIGVFFCLMGLLLLGWSILSFGQSFRVGIDVDRPDKLVTNGAFSISRNPIYVAFSFILLGQFFIFPNWILLVFMCAAFWLFHRQVLREEDFLRGHYGQEYFDYSQKVRRYL